MFDDVRTHEDQLLADPKFDANFDQLIDMTRATKLDLTVGEARIIAERPLLSAESRRAFVATEPDIFALGRMMAAYHERSVHTEVHVFYSIYEALVWLVR